VRLLPDYSAPPAPIYAVYPTRQHLSAKVRPFGAYLVERSGEAGAVGRG